MLIATTPQCACQVSTVSSSSRISLLTHVFAGTAAAAVLRCALRLLFRPGILGENLQLPPSWTEDHRGFYIINATTLTVGCQDQYTRTSGVIRYGDSVRTASAFKIEKAHVQWHMQAHPSLVEI